MKNRFQNLPFKFQLAALQRGNGNGGGEAAGKAGWGCYTSCELS
jgi:hypothetical protein